MPNIKLYTAKLSPPGRSVELTAKALGLELDIVPINLLAQKHLTAAFRKLNPQHTIPVIDDNGTIVWDSHAINVYLVSKYGKPEGDSLYPSDVVQRSKEPILYYGAAETPQEKIDNLYRAYELLNDTLVDEYIVGNEMTLADLSCIASIASMHAIFPIDAGKYPRLAGWVERLAKLPYYEATNLAGAEELAQLYRAKLEQNRTNAK
uniref:glutathione transferase n=1 Tax=Anopheles arabiensis TaxID=7173 RepID=W5S697_ANOAR|nr:glutathione-S-transferase E4 [Anopheles arabiensis]